MDKPEDLTHQEMLEWVKDIAEFSDNTYGERCIQKVLNTMSFPMGRRKTAQLMIDPIFRTSFNKFVGIHCPDNR